jgi:hypothetical protein
MGGDENPETFPGFSGAGGVSADGAPGVDGPEAIDSGRGAGAGVVTNVGNDSGNQLRRRKQCGGLRRASAFADTIAAADRLVAALSIRSRSWVLDHLCGEMDRRNSARASQGPLQAHRGACCPPCSAGRLARAVSRGNRVEPLVQCENESRPI